jgi:hypothetical protein
MVSWKADNGPCFKDYRARPFWMEHSGERILEVPVSIGLNRKISDMLERIYLRIPRFTKIRGLLSKDNLNLLDLFWLYPASFSEKEMTLLADAMIARGERVFNVFFHSSEIKTGESIYTKTDDDLNEYLNRLELFLNYAVNEKGMSSVTLTEYINYHIE